jgi:hypothetical protein
MGGLVVATYIFNRVQYAVSESPRWLSLHMQEKAAENMRQYDAQRH